jgi:uncharacterized protein YbjT (DUF2867 family)
MNVVSGVTGQTGAAVAQTLLQHGAPVRVIVRDAAKGAAWKAQGAEVAVANLTDVATLTRAFAGATAAYVINPPVYTNADMFADAAIVINAVRQAIASARLAKLVVLSSVGAHLPTGTGNIRTTWLLEQQCGQLAIPITFIRAAWFMENWAPVAPIVAKDGVLPSFLTPLDRAIPMVAAADIGRVSGEAMLEEWNGSRIIELSGPRDYSPNDVAEAFAKARGRSVQAVALSETQWPQVLGQMQMSAHAVSTWCEMLRGFNSGLITFENTRVIPLRGRVPLEDVVATW